MAQHADEGKAKVLPVYFVADESGSMGNDVEALNEGLRSLYDAMQLEPLAASKVRFSIIGFSDTAIEHLSLAALASMERHEMPTLSAISGTSYRAALEDLVHRIPDDVRALKADNYLVHRPAVFFLTDGQPNTHEDWRAVHARLTSPDLYGTPNILAFGVGTANPATIRDLASRPEWAFVAAAGSDTGMALAEFIKALTRSVVNSGRAVATGDANLVVEQPATFQIAAPLI